MSFRCGIVGLPNVGKSTLFNLITNAGALSENYPFCTIDPNVGIACVSDERLEKIAKIVNPKKIIPTIVEFVDIAGLVKGACKGQGLGNKFLSHIREVDAIVHVVRCFEDSNVTHVDNAIDPVQDAEVINTELILSDLEHLDKFYQKYKKNRLSGGDKNSTANLDLLELVLSNLNKCVRAETGIKDLNLAQEQLAFINSLNLLTMKDFFYVANVSDESKNTVMLDKLQAYAAKDDKQVLSIAMKLENEVLNLDENERKLFLKEFGIQRNSLEVIISAAYNILNFITFFTAGPKEVRAWTIKRNEDAVHASGKIHTDFIKNFIRAQVISYDDYIKFEGEKGAKENGKCRLEGKTYIVKDGDIMHFLVSQ